MKRWLMLALLTASCGQSGLGTGETTPTLPGDDPVGESKPGPAKPAPARPAAAEPDPWAGKKDLIQPPAARAPGKVALPPIERFELPSGLQVLVVASHQLPVVSFHLAVRAGQLEEPRDKRGLADFVAAMLSKGTRSRNAAQIAESVDQVGASLGAGVDLEGTHVTCSALAKNASTCFTLLPDVVMNPSFAEKEMELVRQQIVGVVKQRRDDPSALVEDHFDNLLWGDDHARGWPVTLDTIAAIGRQDLVDWHAARFKPGNAVLVVAGDVDAKQVRAQVEKAFAGWKKSALPEPKKFAEPVLKGVRVRLVDKPNLAQALIRVGHLGVAHGDPDYLASLAVNQSFGGGQDGARLAAAARAAKGKGYLASSQLDRFRTRGAFQATMVAGNADAGAALKLLLGELGKMQQSGPTASELAEAKASLAGAYPLGSESAAATASAVLAAELHGLGDEFLRDFPVRVAAVPLDQARAAAKKHLDADDVVVVIVGKAEDIAPQLKKAGIPFELLGWLAPVSKRDRDAQVAARNAPPDPRRAAEGRKLIDQAIAARGGEKKLTGVKQLFASGQVTINPPQGKPIVGDFVRYFRAPDVSRSDITLPGRGTVKLVVSPGSAWVEFQKTVQDIPAEAVAAINVLLFVDPERVLLHGLDKSFVVQSEGKQPVDGTDYDAVLVRSGDGLYEATLLLDPKTHLVFRVLYSVQGETLFDEYRDYKPVAGVQVAHKVRTLNLLLQVPVEITYDKVQINAGVPADAFDKPSP